LSIGTISATPIIFGTSNAERMRIESSGNVGIGTSSPLAKLQVYPTVGAPASSGNLNTGVIFAEGAGGPSLNMGNFNSGGTYYAWIQSAFVNNASVVQPLVLQQIGGNVGIGTTSPGGRLDVVGGRTFLAAASETFACGVRYVSTGGAFYFGASNGTATPDGVFSQAGGSERMRITDSGNVGIGTASPLARLNAQADNNNSDLGQLIVSGATNSNKRLSLGFNTTSNYGFVQSLIAGDNYYPLVLQPTAGDLLVGGTTQRDSAKITCETSANGLAVYVVPNTSAVDFAIFRANAGTLCGAISRVGTTAAVVYTATSDYRLKENVMPMTGALDRVAALKPVTFTWKDGGVDAEGFIAHEFAEVCPHGVIGEKDGVDENANPKYQAMDSSVAIPILTAAIQEQQALIQSLTTRLNALEGN